MNKLVTVIIPTYKRAHALPKAIESVKNQSYKEWEIIIVDDNDPLSDERKLTTKVMAEYNGNQQIKYICHSENQGACQARNTGLKEAKGDYIAFLDDDDLWIETKLDKQVSALNSSGVDICYSDMYQEYKGLRRYFTCVNDNDLYVSLLKQGFGICTSALLISTHAMRAINGFDNSLPSMQDYDLLLRLSKKYNATRIAEPLITYQLADDGISCNPVNKANGHRAIINKYQREYERLTLYKGLARQFESLADFELRSGIRLKAIQHYFKALSIYFFSPRVVTKLVAGAVLGKAPLEYYLMKRLEHESTRIEHNA